MQKRKNIDSIELMRGIAALMVAYFHLARGNSDFLDHSNPIFIAGAKGWAGVQIFFVISGFIITYAMFHGGYTIKRVHNFVVKRFVRLEPPYIVSIALVLLLSYVSTLSPYYRGSGFNINWGNVLGHLGYVNAFTGAPWLQDVYWTLAIEFEFYLGLALIYPLLTSANKIYSYIAMLGLLALSQVHIEVGQHVFEYLPFFILGISYCLFTVGKYNKVEFGVVALLSTLLVIYNFNYFLLSLGLVTIAAIAFIKSVPKPFKWLGKVSYSLYLLHIPIGGRVINLSEVLLKEEWQRSIAVFVALGICLFASHLFYKLVEKPFQKISKNIKY